MTDTDTPEYPRPYKEQRKREASAMIARRGLLKDGAELPPVCGYTYYPRKPASTSKVKFDWRVPAVCYCVAGANTNHLGSGYCDYHEVEVLLQSDSKSTTKQFQAAKAIAYENATLFGVPKPTNPFDAIMDEISRTAGIVEWLNHHMKQMETDGSDAESILQQYSVKMGFQPSVWYQLFIEERKHLVATCTAAIKAGVAERKVQIAEQQGRLIAMMFTAFIHDPRLGLTPDQILAAPKLISEHLTGLPTEPTHPAQKVIEATAS